MQLDPDGTIPRIIEGTDPFDEQTASLQYLAEETAPDPKKEDLVRELYGKLMALIPGMTPEQARDEFIFKFGVAPKDMNFMGLYEAKQWVSRLVAQPLAEEETQ